MIEGKCHCGRSGWTLKENPGSVTSCNCTLCRRYGALWAYGYEGPQTKLFGDTGTYTRSGKDPSLELHFCATCAGVVGYRSLHLETNGGRKIAVNVRFACPDAVMDLAVERFDGLNSFEDLPNDGRCVRDLWF